jgi:hypothetical protein
MAARSELPRGAREVAIYASAPVTLVLSVYPGDPPRLCKNCEHFDGGGLKADGTHEWSHGDCHNGISGRFQTNVEDTCSGFYPDTVRWPLDKRMRGL